MKSVFLFPGQGSQSIGMLSDIAAAHQPLARDLYRQASRVLGYDLWHLTQQGPAEQLNQTEYTQPALLAASVLLWRLYCQTDRVLPDMFAGHSLGEYTALVCSDALQFADAIALVAQRGRLMQQAVEVGQGAMAAIIGLDNDSVAKLCHEASQQQVVSPANYNSIGQVVISGDKSAVERAVILAKNEGAKLAKLLAVSVPSHCALMAGAGKELGTIIANTAIRKPKIPIVHNSTATTITHPDDIRQALVEQLSSPVLWVDTIHFFLAAGITDFVECGPGKVLTGLIKRIDRGVRCQNIEALLAVDG